MKVSNRSSLFALVILAAPLSAHAAALTLPAVGQTLKCDAVATFTAPDEPATTEQMFFYVDRVESNKYSVASVAASQADQTPDYEFSGGNNQGAALLNLTAKRPFDWTTINQWDFSDRFDVSISAQGTGSATQTVHGHFDDEGSVYTTTYSISGCAVE